MTEINVTNVVTYSTINDMASDVAANMADDMAFSFLSLAHLLLGPFWNWAAAMGHFSAHYNSTQIETH